MHASLERGAENKLMPLKHLEFGFVDVRRLGEVFEMHMAYAKSHNSGQLSGEL